MAQVTTTAEYMRMAEDSLEQSWEHDTTYESRTLAIARAQVYATLAVAMSAAAGALAAETTARLAQMEGIPYEVRDE